MHVLHLKDGYPVFHIVQVLTYLGRPVFVSNC